MLQRYYGVRSSRVICFILTNMFTPYRLCNTCLGFYSTQVMRSGTTLHGATNTYILSFHYAHITTLCSTYSHMAPVATLSPPKNKYGACEAADNIILNIYTTSYTDFDLDRSFTGIFPDSNMAPEGGARLRRGILPRGGTFILDEKFTSPLIFPTGRTGFPPHLPPSP